MVFSRTAPLNLLRAAAPPLHLAAARTGGAQMGFEADLPGFALMANQGIISVTDGLTIEETQKIAELLGREVEQDAVTLSALGRDLFIFLASSVLVRCASRESTGIPTGRESLRPREACRALCSGVICSLSRAHYPRNTCVAEPAALRSSHCQSSAPSNDDLGSHTWGGIPT